MVKTTNMKTRSIFISAGLLMLAGLSSCRKDQSCSCTVDGTTTVVVYNQETKKNAEKACDKRAEAAKLVDASASCEVTD